MLLAASAEGLMNIWLTVDMIALGVWGEVWGRDSGGVDWGLWD